MGISNGLLFQWGLYTESNGYTDYKYFPIAFSTKYFTGQATQYQMTTTTAFLPWINNEDGSLTHFLCGLDNDVTQIAGYYVNIFVIGV